MDFSPDLLASLVERLGFPTAALISILWVLAKGYYVSRAHLTDVVEVLTREHQKTIDVLEAQADAQATELLRQRGLIERMRTLPVPNVTPSDK